MATQTLKDFVEERLLAFDPTIDISEGSPAQYQVVDPIVRRFTPDPFEMTVEKFIAARLAQEFTDVNFREGSAVYDFLSKGASVLLDPISREVQLIKQGQSFAYPELLAESEADALAANLFVTRATGGLSTGTVRLYFNAPMALNISVGNVCYTADGLRFLPTTLQSITAEAMIFNQSGGLYYFDIQVTAEKAGTDYNVDKGDIVGITNLNAAVLVENTEDFENGLDAETTQELVDKAETSITERSLVVARGVSARLYDQFEDLVSLQVVGMLEEEMMRDIITGGDLGPDLLQGVDGYTEDDEDGDALTYSFKTRYGDFLSVFGSLGDVEAEYYLRVNSVLYGTDAQVPITNLDHLILPVTFTTDDVGGMVVILQASDPANLGTAKILAKVGANEIQIDRTGAAESGMVWMLLRPPKQVGVVSVLSSQELRLDEALEVDQEALVWSIHRRLLTISDIPGGVMFSAEADTLEIEPDEVHIGGASDFYVRGTSVSEKTLVLSSISDSEPLVSGLDLIGDTTYDEFVYSPTADFVTEGVRPGHSLVIETGVNAGTKTVLRVGVQPSGAPGSAENYLQIDDPITSNDSSMRYKVVDEIDIDLRNPRTIRGVGDDLETIQLGTVVTTASAVDFSALGAAEGDTLEILSGADKGKYTVNAISGTGNRNLQLAAQMSATADNLSYELYEAQEGISFPLVRITGLEILDSSSQPTGYVVPYACPVDARSSSFSNAGIGTKVSTSDATTGIVAAVDLDSLSYPLASTILTISVNGTPVAVDLTSAASRHIVLARINSAIFNIASYITVDGKDYLTLRSGDRWLSVSANAQNANIGFDVTGEDNRQIRSASNITDWTAANYDLRVKKDAVFVSTGDNIGFLYLIQVSAFKLLAVGFDEEGGTLRFLQPNVNVTVTVGSRSYGNARVYFLDPTSFEVRGSWHPALKRTSTHPANAALAAAGDEVVGEDEDPVTYFTVKVGNSYLRFFPDPDMKQEILPCSGDDPPNNLITNGSAIVESDASPPGDTGKNSRDAAIDFLTREIKAGDLLSVTYQPIQASNDIRVLSGGLGITYPDDLEGLTLILTIGDNPLKVVTFTDQLTGPDDVVDEINEAMGEDVAYIETISGAKFLRLEADFQIIYHYNSTSGAVFWLSAPLANIKNKAVADIDDYYTIEYVGSTLDPTQHSILELSQNAAASQSQHFHIYRPGVQRLHSTGMSENLENGLYYMDVELISEGVGNEWNLDPDEIFEVTGYKSDGYRLEVQDENFSFSTEEEVTMVLSQRVLTVGSSDRPDQATILSGQNLQVSYERSPLVSSIQSFAKSQLERVLTASLLVRHLQPHYINFELNYRGGSSADVVGEDVSDYMDGLGPDDRVEVSDIQDFPLRRGATYVQNPIELVAVVHNEKREITVERSKDYVTHGRLATFFTGTIKVSRETPSSL